MLRVVGGGKGYTGGTTLSATTYVQRLDTRGGQAPANGCDAATVGAGAAMPYAADYYFLDCCDLRWQADPATLQGQNDVP